MDIVPIYRSVSASVHQCINAIAWAKAIRLSLEIFQGKEVPQWVNKDSFFS